ncbi:M23 family metallopeptidase [Streptomyces sp. NRRL S-87]|uniref:M23 family metallopeptidase n=1 Tax=Streptomyces sp. NRRL S-87 TaxID=1463920 RepID=UPI000689C68C|nr:M23 family metallopeptidase [Streptomyces sp. NRRL S-87]
MTTFLLALLLALLPPPAARSVPPSGPQFPARYAAAPSARPPTPSPGPGRAARPADRPTPEEPSARRRPTACAGGPEAVERVGPGGAGRRAERPRRAGPGGPAAGEPEPVGRPPARTGPATERPLPAPLRLLRWWVPPPGPYAAGHRGVDLAAAPGTEVRAVADGRVYYAGRVAGRGVLSLTLTGTALRTTYEPVCPLVATGEPVLRGQVVARTEPNAHCARPCLHWGLRAGEDYLDPLSLLPRPTPRLLPLTGTGAAAARHGGFGYG